MTTSGQAGSEVLAAQPRALIVTIYGLYARESDGWFSVAALIKLMAELGVEEPAVRSAGEPAMACRRAGRKFWPTETAGSLGAQRPARTTAGCWRCSASPNMSAHAAMR